MLQAIVLVVYACADAGRVIVCRNIRHRKYHPGDKDDPYANGDTTTKPMDGETGKV